MLELVVHDRSVPVHKAEVLGLVQAILRGEKRRMNLTVAIVGDLEARRWNRRCLQHDWSTDAIAQAYSEDEGDVVVNAARALREARKRGHAASAELLFYVAHGLLHLLGYDDGTPMERVQMLQLQSRYLARLGYSVR
ncbi:MAG: rRNA maturation RNase YbeY [Planctomycetes bacterium]|nr:rRNA maturation RNase YbeY [Planctomycetota bacterium]